MRRLNRYVEERAPWKLAKDEGAAAELDTVLASLTEGLRVLGVVLAPWLPDSTAKLLAALGRPELDYALASFGAATPEQADPLDPLFPKHQ